MAESSEAKVTDPFAGDKCYPDTTLVFSCKAEAVNVISKDWLVVLDTNVLLIPYTLNPSNLRDIEKAYEKLATEKRLFIPGQVVREFAKHRPRKLAELHSSLLNMKGRQEAPKATTCYPLLQSLNTYEDLKAAEDALGNALKTWQSHIDRSIKEVSGWRWDDGVSEMYRKLFSSTSIFENKVDAASFTGTRDSRFSAGIPPGFKDAGKSDGGGGDLLIWLAILEIGRLNGKNLVFVTQEKKSDWWHLSNDQTLYTRFELVYEYFKASGGKTFQLITLSQLLEGLDAEEAVVSAVRVEESRQQAEAEDVEIEPELQRRLDQLPKDLRDTYVLCELRGMRYRDAAEALGIKSGTVGWRLYSARRALLDLKE